MDNHHIGIHNFIAKTRHRKPQWIHKETQHLIREFDKRKDILRPKQGKIVSSAVKHRAWVEISQAVNLTNPHVYRTVSEVQKKWQNLCLRMKKTQDKTSDNGSDDRKDVESLILEQSQSFIGQEDGEENIVNIKVEHDDNFEHSGNVIHVDGTVDRHDGRRSQTNYSDVDYSSQPEFMVFHDESGSQQSRGVKRVFEDDSSFSSHYQGDVELLSLKKQSLLAEMQTYRMQCDKLQMEKEKLKVETEKMSLEKDKVTIELQNFRTANQQMLLSQHKSHSQLEKERMALENEKLTIEIRTLKNQNQVTTEKMQLEKARLMLENDKLNLEIQRIRNQGNKHETHYVM